MKRISFISSLVMVSILCGSETGSAREFANGLSYVGSKWQEYKQLPYERCSIRHSLDGSSYHKAIWSDAYMEFRAPSMGLFVPFKGLQPVYADYYLTCWTGVNNWAFAIPIHLDKLSFKGFAIEFMGSALKFEFHELDGKPMSAIEGEYKGIMGSMGFLAAGFKRGRLRNESKVRLGIKGWYAGTAGISLGRGKFRVQLGKDRTHLVDKTDGDKVTEISDLMDYRFVKVRWDSIPVPPEVPVALPPHAAPRPAAASVASGAGGVAVNPANGANDGPGANGE